MAASGRFDLSLSRTDVPSYAAGQRGPYAAPPLERSGSFREGSDRVLSLPLGTSKASTGTPQGDMSCLLQSLASDLKGIVPDPKLNRPGEMKRAMSSIFGASTENSTSSTFETKPLPSYSLEEIKRLKNNLQENSTKARDRARSFGTACSMIDKFWHLKRKRSRIGSSLSERTTGFYPGGIIPKTGPQSHVPGSGLDIGSQREDKPKVGVPNRRTRTSLLDTDIQANGTTRISGPLERDKDMLKAINGSTSQLAENDGAFSAVPDGWDRSKLKKKRSVLKSDASSTSGLARLHGEEGEAKRRMQQRLSIDARPKMNHAHNFRPGSDTSASLVENSDLSPQQHSANIRTRNELSNGSLLNERRDVRFGPDNEAASLKVITKPNNREDRCTASTAFLKFGSFRPRTNSCSLSKASSNINRVVGNSDDVELLQTTDKVNALCVNNRKRAACIRSSSPPVGQWAVHRPKKSSRSTRRSSLSPLVSSHDDLSVSEAVDEEPTHHDNLGVSKHAISNALLPSKMRGDNSASASLSGSEESGVQENELPYKVDKCSEKEDKSGQTVQKSANLIMTSRKNRIAIEEDSGDSHRRQGRIGRSFAPTRSGLSARIEKLGEAVTAKQQRSVRHGSERIESKPGRPPIKKLSERKTCTRPKQSINILSVQSSEEAADDHEELVSAANAALDNGRACSGSFWKQLEPNFSFVSLEDIAFLHEQIQLTNESAVRNHGSEDNSQNLKIDHGNATISSGPLVTSNCKSNAFSEGINFYRNDREKGFTKDRVLADPFLEVLSQNRTYGRVSICQALLSAIIEEDDIENIHNAVDYGEAYAFKDSYPSQFGLGKDLKSQILYLKLEDSQTVSRTSECCKASNNLSDRISSERPGTNGILENYNRPVSSFQQAPGQLIRNQAPLSTGCTEFQYNQMSINDRIILELSEIGLFPEVEPVPDLTYDEDEDISESMHILEERLHEKAANRKNLLIKLEKAVMNDKELQLRKLERLAMDRLVCIAYDKYMACWGSSSSGIRNPNKIVKHSTLKFMKQTLVRCQKFEETGISCFDEPAFRDIFLSASSRGSNSQSINIPANDHKAFKASQTTQTDGQCSGAAVDQPFSEDDPWSNRAKKKELFLDVVAGGTVVPSSRTPPGLGNPLASGAKGKRSERDRDGKAYGRDSAFKSGPAKIGRPPISGGAKGERRNRPKPKMKMAHLSASVNVLHGKNSEGGPISAPGSRANRTSNDGGAVDLNSLQLPDIDVGDFGGQGQDIASWLNFEDEGLQDHGGDCMGLEIPMDDLSEVHMMI